MLFKFMIALTISTNFVLALDKHDPKVYEEEIEEAPPAVVRKARHHNEKYRPPIFVYDKSSQPDLRRWRYYQQQQIDLKHMGNLRQRLESSNVFRNGHLQYRTAQESLETMQSSRPVQPKWKVVHPKFVIEKQQDFSPSELIRMQEEYGKRRVQRVPLTESLNSNRRARRQKSNISGEVVRDYKVKEADLDVEASEIEEVHSPVDRHDQFSVILPPNIVPKAIYVNPKALAELVSTNAPATDASAQNYYQTNQKDVHAINSILGSTTSEQLNGLKQFLHSQSAHVASLPNQLSQNTHEADGNEANVQKALIDAGINNPEIQKVLQTKGQTFEEMQAQLNAIAQQEGAKAIAEAQQKAFEYVQSQRRAIEHAELEGRRAALDKIKTYNLQVAEPLPQALALTQSQPLINDANPTQNVDHQNTEEAPKSVPRTVDENTILHAHLQAQAYLQLASQNHHSKQQKEQIPNSSNVQVQNIQTFVEPEVNHNGLNGINVDGQSSQEESNANGAHVQLAAQAYQNLVAQVYAQPPEDLQQLQGNSQSEHVQEQRPYEEKHDEGEYAPKYSFGYRIMDYHTGTDFGHEEKREGKLTNGRYHVLLPDGRVQRVNYWADLSGYHAKVTYSDVARH